MLQVTTRLPDLPAVEAEVASEATTAVVPGPPITIDGPISVELADPAARVEPPLRSITLAFTGDTLIHSPLNQGALDNGGGVTYDYAPMFAAVAPILSSVDLAVCHLETPVAPPGEELSTFPRLGSLPRSPMASRPPATTAAAPPATIRSTAARRASTPV